MVNALVVQFRRGRKTVTPRHFLIEIEGVDSKEKALKFVGSEVVWTSPGKVQLKGRIAASHGTKGVTRAIFEKGLPGQAIGTECVVSEGKAEVKKTKSKEVKK